MNVTIGSGCSLYSCFIDNDVFVGDKCVILEGARLEKGCQLAPGSVVPPGRLIPAKQLWAGNPVEYVKDLDVGELWANYTYSYVNTMLGDANIHEFSPWPSNYLLKESKADDAEPNENDLIAANTSKHLYKGIVKYYI